MSNTNVVVALTITKTLTKFVPRMAPLLMMFAESATDLKEEQEHPITVSQLL